MKKLLYSIFQMGNIMYTCHSFYHSTENHQQNLLAIWPDQDYQKTTYVYSDKQ